MRYKNFIEKHGSSAHKLYFVRAKMIQRCLNPNSPAFPNYGGRGITICNEWLNSFLVFYYWAIENDWNCNLEIDRIDNEGNYNPDNCRFVSTAENLRNRRKPKKYKRPTSVKKKSNLPTGVVKRHNKYRASIYYEGKAHYLGNFNTSEEAHKKYLEELAKIS